MTDPISIDVAALRRDYAQATLDESTLQPDPYDQFAHWLQQACTAQLLEPNAMVLSTQGGDGFPDARTVLLKKYDRSGLVFFTNFESKKARQIEADPRVCLVFPWYGLERQVTIHGWAEKAGSAETLAYFITRPLLSRLGAWASPQSKVITSRSLLEMKFEEMKKKFADGEVPVPSFWGGFRVKPVRYEFWQGRRSRLHDRFRYEKQADTWKIERLAP